MMDENFEDKADEFAEDAAQAAEEAAENTWDHVEETAEQAGEHIEQAAENAWDHVEEPAERTSQVAVNAWDKVEDTAEQAGEHIDQAAENAWDQVEEEHVDVSDTIEETAETVQGTWSEVGEDSSAVQHKHEHTYGDEYVPDISDKCCEPDAQPDPFSAGEFASSPIGIGPDLMGPTITAKDVRAIRSDHIADSQKEGNKKRDFPIWAIILIILLVLCICIILPVLLVFGGGIAIFRDLFGTSGAFLPYMFF
jgi:hypothetical protein